MSYSKIQKFLSILCIMLILSAFTFRVPISQVILSDAYADNLVMEDIVSIIVTESIYSEIESEIKRYSNDISAAMPNVRPVIVPVPDDAKPFEIASVNEKLYYEGYDDIFQSRLIGTVMVGDIPVPTVYSSNSAGLSILPYTDFHDKSFIYSFSSGKYIENSSNSGNEIKPEIWHGILAPNTGSISEDVDKLVKYFDKNHDFYSKKGFYTKSKTTKDEPFVFYFDSIREYNAMSFLNYKAYKLGLEYLEDFAYLRFTKEFAKTIQDKYISYQNASSSGIAPTNNTGMELSDIPDVQTRFIVQKLIKKFPEVINGTVLGEIQKDVYNAGRYNKDDTEINVDLIPTFISTLDDFSKEVIKDANDDIEKEIDKIVENGLSRKIALFVDETLDVIPGGYTFLTGQGQDKKFTNFIAGVPASKIDSPISCSVYRGGSGGSPSKKIEANRGYNVSKIRDDINLLKAEGEAYPGGNADYCLSPMRVDSRFGGNTPLNLKEQTGSGFNPVLKSHNNRKGIVPIYDIVGAKAVSSNGQPSPDPSFCESPSYNFTVKTEYKLSYTERHGDTFDTRYQTVYIPTNGKAKTNFSSRREVYEEEWNCRKPLPTGTYRKYQYNDELNGEELSCREIKVNLDGKLVYHRPSFCPDERRGDDTYKRTERKTVLNYKTIPSIIYHKAPTVSDLKSEIQGKFTESLPVDKDRGVSFIPASMSSSSVFLAYPSLYRLGFEQNEEVTFDAVGEKLKKMINSKSFEINGIIANNNSSSLSGSVYSGLKTGSYPSPNVNLYSKMKNGGTVNFGGKQIDYLDTIEFALYWNNLDSVQAKYKFVLENYLTDQANNDFNFPLPGNKSFYEIAYLKGLGNAESMFINMDPENKGQNPYGYELQKIAEQNAALSGVDSDPNDVDAMDDDHPYADVRKTCFPASGVEIYEWLPAMECWFEEVKKGIQFEPGYCSTYEEDSDPTEAFSGCYGDENGNGITDCLEKTSKVGVSGPERLYIREEGAYDVNLLYQDPISGDELVNYTDNESEISLEILEIKGIKDESKQISSSNSKVVYSIGGDEEILDDYLVPVSSKIVPSSGRAKLSILARNKIADVTFRVKVEMIGDKESNNKTLYSENKTLKIRKDKISAITNKIEIQENEPIISFSNATEVSESNNIFLYDSSELSIGDDLSPFYSQSEAKEKLFFGIDSVDDKGVSYGLSFPLNIKLSKGPNNIVLEKEVSAFGGGIYSLGAISESGLYDLEIKDSKGDILTKEITFLPSVVDSIEFEPTTNTIEKGNVKTQNFIFLKDRFGNIVSGDYHKINVDISGSSLSIGENGFEGEKSYELDIYEGIKSVLLESTNSSGISNVSISYTNDDGDTFSNSKSINVVDEINFELSFSSNMEVGGNEYDFEIKTTNVSDFDGAAYITTGFEYGYFDEQVMMEGGSGSGTFTTSTLAGEDIIARVKVAGTRSEKQYKFIIYPGDPVRVAMYLNKDSIEYQTSENAVVRAELLDMYGNLVFNDSSSKVSFELKDEYTSILNVDNGVRNVNKGVAQFIVTPGSQPGTGYFKLEVTPGLESNTFKIDDAEYTGYSIAIGRIDNLFKLRGENVADGYNSIYTTLIGGDYGNFTKENYLAGDLIFSEKSKALAVTSLIDKGTQRNIVFSLSTSGGFATTGNSDLTQNIKSYIETSETQKLKIGIINKSNNRQVGTILYNLDNANLFQCIDSINECIDNNSLENGIYVYSGSSNIIDASSSKISVLDSENNNIVTISDSGNIYGLPMGHKLRLSAETIGYLVLDVVDNSGTIKAKIAIKNTGNTFYTRSGIKPSGKTILNLTSYSYSVDNVGEGEFETFLVEYIDPFETPSASNFAKMNDSGYEMHKKNGLGWNSSNQTLLGYSAGENVGEATKNYASFGLINIGDPVVSVVKERALTDVKNTSASDRPFDSSIGKLIGDFENLNSYKLFDYNNDSKDDLIVFLTSGEALLFENHKGKFLERGALFNAYDSLPDSEFIVGDFFGDGYDDVIFLNNRKEISVYKNNFKDFERAELTLDFDTKGEVFDVAGFDMDNDGVTDLVTLDDAGYIDVFYGGSDVDGKYFTKQNIGSGYALNISSDVNDINGAVYYDGLMSEDEMMEAPDFQETSDKLQEIVSGVDPSTITNASPTGSSSGFDLGNLEGFIFYTFQYLDLPNGEDKLSSYEELGYEMPDELRKQKQPTKFIKSENLDSFGISYQKTYTDINDKPLRKGDILKVEIGLTSDYSKSGFVLAEKIPDVMAKTQDFKVLVNGEEVNVFDAPENSDGFDFMIKIPTLSSSTFYNISYELVTKPYKYGSIEAGLFESGEVGDDEYGDVIYNLDGTSCSIEKSLIRSIGFRNYEEGDYPRYCPSNDLPEDDSQKDENKNGIPDNIDNLQDISKDVKSGDTSRIDELVDFANDSLEDISFDLNGDGLDNDSEVDFLDAITSGGTANFDSINSDIDKFVEASKDLQKGFQCGFGGGCKPVPFNWAPLAPGQDPTFLGRPIGDGFRVNEGIPIFSYPTIGPINVLGVPAPPIWPPNYMGAGGIFDGSTSTFRIFHTPTLTGSSGTAICTGINAVAGMIPPPGTSPIVPGGNCIVVAGSKNSCGSGSGGGIDEGKDGAHSDYEFPYSPVHSSGDYDIYNANCPGPGDDVTMPTLPSELVDSYLEGDDSKDFGEKVSEFFSKEHTGEFSLFGNDVVSSSSPPTATFSYNDEGGFQYQEPEIIRHTRVEGFPGIIMGWVSAQIEEFVTSLTDWPRLIIIFPDVGDMFASVKGLSKDKMSNEWELAKKEIMENEGQELKALNKQLSLIQNKIESLEKANKAGTPSYFSLKEKEEMLRYDIATKETAGKLGVSSVKAAYEFIGKLPMVTIEEEELLVKLPTISYVDIERMKYDFLATKEQWKSEIEDKRVKWNSILMNCDNLETDEKRQVCRDQINASISVLSDFNRLINQIDRNIEIIEEYQNIPEDLYYLLNKKEERLDQIICNIEIIGDIISGWLKENGEIFKSWVELYITIKAILKSWQALLDIFYGYEEECKECKNERYDSIGFHFELILPEFPVLKMPRLPDIIFDLHNIRAGIAFTVPTFEIVYEPISMPDLPNLYLPEVPSANFALRVNLPDIGLLPRVQIPELPDIPSLPKPILPTLPPPPKLPPLFPEISAFLDLIKLFTSALCLMSKSPFVPEWRAGDHIAYLTEKPGFLDIHFMFDLSVPKPKFSFIDAIKVSTYINFQDQQDVFVEPIRNFVDKKINTIGGDLTNKLSGGVRDIDLRGLVPDSIDFEGNIDLEDGEGSLDSNIGDLEAYNNNFKNEVAYNFTKESQKIFDEISKSHQSDLFDAGEVINKVYNELHSEKYISMPELDNLRKIWKDAKFYDYEKENNFISELEEFNKEKIDYLKSIIETEKEFNKDDQKKIKEILDKKSDIGNEYASLISDSSSRIKAYNEGLSKYNSLSIKKDYSYSNGISDEIIAYRDKQKEISSKSRLLANATGNEYESTNSCPNDGGGYQDVQNGVYIAKNGINYRLFDFLDDYSDKTKITPFDIDSDSDDDILYDVDGKIFLKENLKTTNNLQGLSYIELGNYFEDNIFEGFIPSVSGFKQTSVDSNFINSKFRGIDIPSISNYRMESQLIIDKFGYNDGIVQNIKKRKSIVDMFVDIDDITLTNNSFTYEGATLRNNLGYFKVIGNDMSDITVESYDFESINSKISNGVIVNLTSGTSLFTASGSAKIQVDNGIEIVEYSIPEYSNIVFDASAKIVGIEGNAYIKSQNVKTFVGSEINKLRHMPILPGTKVNSNLDKNSYTPGHNIEFEYYDGSTYGFSFIDVANFEIYDLGNRKLEYSINLDRQNDFYYSKIYAFSENIRGTYSGQLLLSPQKYADVTSPEVLVNIIKVPVYTKYKQELERVIYDDGGVDNLFTYIDLDLEVDSDGDGDKTNDVDTSTYIPSEKVSIDLDNNKYYLEIGPFQDIFSKKIKVWIEDSVGNKVANEIYLVSYAPIPDITDNDETLLEGSLDTDYAGIPVTIFRLRNGKLESINNDGDEVISKDAGKFDYLFSGESGAEIIIGGEKIGDINEETGVIDFQDGYSYSENTRVIPSFSEGNDTGYPLMILKVGNREVYKQYVSVPDQGNVNFVETFDDYIDTNHGVFAKFINQGSYSSHVLPLDIPNDPGALVVFDKAKNDSTPVITILRDGKIILNDNSLIIKAKNYSGALVYSISKNNKDIIDVMILPDGNSIIK